MDKNNGIDLRRRALAGALALGLAAPAAIAQAQPAYPSKPIRLVTPFPPGGAADTLARALGKSMNEATGTPVVVENRAGAGGTIGTATVAKAEPDGYTLLLGNVSTLATAPSLYAKLPYDPLRDFTPITLVGRSPLVFSVGPGVQAGTLPELVALAKSDPGKLNYGSSGAGSITHLTGELLNIAAEGSMVHVPYKGSAPVVMAMMSGELDVGVTQVAEMLQQYRAGQVRPLAITGTRRLDVVPQVPTAQELGVPNLEATTWYAVVAPQGLPPQVAQTLQAMMAKALDNPEFRKRYADEGLILESSSSEALAELMRKEVASWAEVVKRSGVRLD
ncbi:tripartite tricarboxylate transporter substrate binding protein [Orrella sp. JC864]|uniref:Bug family tripartite tricarboxylate transporter substrate binding protein n=1 Tax=Orrella sp. JC864 TaxID=3120298 RepID=UPI0030090812